MDYIEKHGIATFDHSVWDGLDDESMTAVNLLSTEVLSTDTAPPTSTIELLERAYEWAIQEGRWCRAWVDIRFDTIKVPSGPLTCGNIAACAMGILVFCTYNGPLIRAYRRTDAIVNDWTDLCKDDPFISEAACLLAAALNAIDPDQFSPNYYPTISQNINDRFDMFYTGRQDGTVYVPGYKGKARIAISDVITINDGRADAIADQLTRIRRVEPIRPNHVIAEGFALAADRARALATA